MNSFSGKFKRLPVHIFFVLVLAQPGKDVVLTSRLRQRGATSFGNDSICLSPHPINERHKGSIRKKHPATILDVDR